MTSQAKIITSLWFDHQAQEAAEFYISLFPNSRITDIVRTATETPSGNELGSVLTVSYELAGRPFNGINGGPMFKLNPSISLFVNCDTADEVETLFNRLSEGGGVMMPLQAYPFSEKFGWVADRYGLSWQINLGPASEKITIALMYTGPQAGKAEEAMRFYTSLFDDGRITHLEHFEAGEEGGEPGSVKFSRFQLAGQEFSGMDSAYPHGFAFNEAISLLIPCATQQEVDRLWAQLSSDPDSENCGWCKDRYGVSWQVVPSPMLEMLSDPDSEKVRRVMEAFLPMKKLELPVLQAAYEGK